MDVLWSIALVLCGGFAAGWLVQKVRLPGLLGMLLFGILIGPFGLDLLSPAFLEQAPTVSVIALMVVITSSFFAIDLDVLRRSAATIGLVGTLPGLLEGFAVMTAAVALLDLSWAQGGILGFTIAVVSPAVVVPTMIRLKESGWGMDKGIPVISLAATNLDGIMAILFWLMFMALELGGGDILGVIGSAVLQIVLGIALGLLVGWLAVLLFDGFLRAVATWLRIVLFLLLCVGVFASGQVLPINAPMALLMFGLYFVNTTKTDIRPAGGVVSKLWIAGSILLFVSIGALSDLNLMWQVGLVGLVVILIGVVARILGALVALNISRSALNTREKLFVGLSTLGKATVQATLSPLVVASGVRSAQTILAVAVMSILLMAPLASIAIEFTYRKLLVQVTPEGEPAHSSG